MNPLLPFKILVWTGPSHKDLGCTVDATIEMDLVPSGLLLGSIRPSSTLTLTRYLWFPSSRYIGPKPCPPEPTTSRRQANRLQEPEHAVFDGYTTVLLQGP